MALTELEKKVVQHCIDRLKQVDTQKIYSFIWNNGLIGGTDEERRAVMDDLSSRLGENVNTRVNDVKEWLTTLLGQ